MQSRSAVAIVGAGFSGSLLALHLLESGPDDLTIFLIERAPGFGRGLAYGTRDPHHLLNVRVGNMSAFPDRPRHLEQWLASWGDEALAHPAAFITRRAYGDYLGSLLRAAVSRPNGAERLLLIHDEVVGLKPSARGLRLTLAMGTEFDVDAAALAVGNLPSAPPAGLDLSDLPEDLYAPDPWAETALEGLSTTAPVLLLGTGLTMVDIALSLKARGHEGTLFGLSRRGLTPRRHGGLAPVAYEAPRIPAVTLSRLLGWQRERARTLGWREAIDALRPAAQALWRGATLTERRRFLRHLRPWWEVHRHRMAPAVADRIEALRAAGQLVTAAGRMVSARQRGVGIEVVWRPRGPDHDQVGGFGRIINCTGPGGEPSLAGPLIRDLITIGLGRADPLRAGLEVDDACRLIGADGAVNPRLYAAGPITKGSFWEVSAVPDIRNQVVEVVARILAELARQPAVAATRLSEGASPFRPNDKPAMPPLS
jgi:uncharacterized NAD(P)/FAD-binding protein YdhS